MPFDCSSEALFNRSHKDRSLWENMVTLTAGYWVILSILPDSIRDSIETHTVSIRKKGSVYGVLPVRCWSGWLLSYHSCSTIRSSCPWRPNSSKCLVQAWTSWWLPHLLINCNKSFKEVLITFSRESHWSTFENHTITSQASVTLTWSPDRNKGEEPTWSPRGKSCSQS